MAPALLPVSPDATMLRGNPTPVKLPSPLCSPQIVAKFLKLPQFVSAQCECVAPGGDAEGSGCQRYGGRGSQEWGGRKCRTLIARTDIFHLFNWTLNIAGKIFGIHKGSNITRLGENFFITADILQKSRLEKWVSEPDWPDPSP